MLTAVLAIVGVLLLLVGGEVLVRGASRLATAAGVSPLIVGLTVVSLCTSAPELAASVAAALEGQADIAYANVVGSNVVNVLLILGSSALAAPLIVAPRLLRVDAPVMVAASLGLLFLSLDGRVGPGDGVLLLGALALYIAWTVRTARREAAGTAAAREAAPPQRGELLRNVGLVLAGVSALVLGAHWMVGGAVALARTLGVSERVIGLTVVAVGTSLPELVTSIVAALRGERDIAVGNVIGSNLFNILAVLGATSAVGGGVAVAPAALSIDLPVMIAAAVACLPLGYTALRIDRWEGGLLVTWYVAYTAFLVLDATGAGGAHLLGRVLLLVAAPATALVLAITAALELRARRAAIG